jgi:hypothetical protein
MPETDGKLLALRVSGVLKKPDYEAFETLVRERADAHGPLRLLVHLQDFAGWESLSGAWADLKFDVALKDDIERVAIVGQRDWEKWVTKLSAPVMPYELKFFDDDQLDQARAWVRE